MKERGRFYIVYEPHNEIKANDFHHGALPIVWNRNGEFCIIPIAVVQNAFDNLGLFNKFKGKITNPEVIILWCQGSPISNQAGRALMGE